MLFSIFIGIVTVTSAGTAVGIPVQAEAKENIKADTVVKAKGFQTLYYIGPDGKRYVFPNEQTFLSWYEDFSVVREVDPADLTQFSLAGNVQYRPGVLLVKIQTDPKVYAVGKNGALRWIKTEELAKKLYGKYWNQLIDDIPVVFFTNYIVAQPIVNEADFNPDNEENSVFSISENKKERARQKIEARIEKRQTQLCEKTEKKINQLQKRLNKKDIRIEGIADDFLEKCLQQVAQQPVSPQTLSNDRQITLCHIPPGNPSARHTITVGRPAAKAHIAHGDTVGACDTGGQTSPFTISGVIASTTSPTTSVIRWTTSATSTSKVVYATSSIDTSTSTLEVIDASLVLNHEITLTGLLPQTQYYFMAVSRDENGNTASSSQTTFTTPAQTPSPDTTAPLITALSVSDTTASTTTISWTTNEPATSVVEYATQGLDTATTTQRITDNTLATSHSIALTGLASLTQYFFRVESVDAAGNVATSTQQTFTTLIAP